jgi:uncharacterized protein
MMHVAWSSFTPWLSLAGGILIGIAAAILILFNGRIAGISGIIGGLLARRSGEVGWQLMFLLGLIVAPLLYTVFLTFPTIEISTGYPTIVLAGLLVGIGTRYGAGCTSGHGVCGLSRLSPRSMVATLSFMAAGFIVTYVVRHLLST